MPFNLNEELEQHVPLGTVNEGLTPSLDPIGEQYKNRLKRESLTNETTIASQDVEAFFRTAAKNNILISGADKLNQIMVDSRYEEDLEFMENYTQDMKLEDLNKYGLDAVSSYARLNSAKNERHRLRILDMLRTEKKNNDFINDTISPKSQMAASVAGALVDIDTLMIGPLANVLVKGGKVANLAKTSFALEGTGVVAKANLMDNYDIAEDGLIDLIAGGFINVAIGKAATSNLRYGLETSPTNMDKPTDLKLIEYKPTIKAGYTVDDLEGEDLFAKGYNVIEDIEFDDAYKSIKRNMGEKEAEEFKKGYEQGKETRARYNATEEKKARITQIEKEIEALEASKIATRGKNKGQPKKLSKKKLEEIDNKINSLKIDLNRETTLDAAEYLEQVKIKELEAKYAKLDMEEARLEEWRRQTQSRLAKAKNKEEALKIEKEQIDDYKARAEEYKKRIEKKKQVELEEARLKKEKMQKDREEFIAKMKKSSTGLKYLYRKTDELIKQASKEADAVKAQREIDEALEFEEMVNKLGDTVEKSLARLGRRLENGSISLDDAEEAIITLKIKFPEEHKLFKSIEKYIRKHRDMDVKSGGKMIEDIVSKFKGLNRLQKAGLVSLLVFAPSSAFADDGETVEDYLLPSIVALAILAGVAPQVKTALANKRVGPALNDIKRSIDKNSSNLYYMISGEGKSIGKIFDRFHKSMSSGWNSSYKGLIAKVHRNIADGDQKDFAIKLIRDLLFNPLDGSIRTLDVAKNQAVKEATGNAAMYYKQAFKTYTRKLGMSRVGGFLNDIELEIEFNRKLADMLDGMIPVEEGFEDVVKAYRNLYTQILDDAVESGVKGAKEARARVKEGNTYFPRIWKFTEIKNIMNMLVREEDKLALIAGLAKGMKGSNPEEKARLLLEWIQEADMTGKMKKSDNTIATIEDFLAKEDFEIGDEKLFELKKILTNESETSGRLKDRVEIDWNKVQFPEIELNGERVKLELDDFVNRDVRDVSAMYANDLYAKTFLAKMNYPSIENLRNKIDATIHNSEIKRELHFALDILLNKPTTDELTTMSQLVELGKGLTFIASMPFVAFSMGVEIAKTIGNAGLSNSLKAFKHQIGALDKNSLEFELLRNSGGLGQHSNMNRFDFKGVDPHAADDVAEWAVVKAVKKAQQFVAKGSGLIDLSDITQKANYLHHVSEFANLIHGKAHKLPKARLLSYGIDENAINMFKSKIELLPDGSVKKFDKADWTLEERTVFNDIMLRLNQEITPEVMVGTQGLWQRTVLGKLTGFLLSYPINLFENQAVKDFHYMDSRTLSNLVITFGASYAGMVAKYEMLGRDYEEEDLIAYSLMNLPSASIFSSMYSALDGPITSNAADLKHDIEALTIDPLKGN